MIEVGQVRIAQRDGYLFDRIPVSQEILGFMGDDFVHMGERRSARILFAKPDQVTVRDTHHTGILLYGTMPRVVLLRQVQESPDMRGDFPALFPF